MNTRCRRSDIRAKSAHSPERAEIREESALWTAWTVRCVPTLPPWVCAAKPGAGVGGSEGGESGSNRDETRLIALNWQRASESQARTAQHSYIPPSIHPSLPDITAQQDGARHRGAILPVSTVQRPASQHSPLTSPAPPANQECEREIEAPPPSHAGFESSMRVRRVVCAG